MRVVFVGLSGVPYSRRACDNRLMAFAKLFVAIGYRVTIYNRCAVKEVHERVLDLDYGRNINFVEGLNINKPSNRLLRIAKRVISYPVELIRVMLLNREESICVIHVYSGHYLELVCYKILSKLIGAKLIYQYVEFRSAIPRKGIYHKINGILCDNHLHRLFDGIISISNFITSHIIEKSPKMPVVKIPPLCDFNYFDSVSSEEISNEQYVLFCGSAGYLDAIKLICDAYNQSNCAAYGINLILVVNGSLTEMREVHNYVGQSSTIDIKTNLHYESLINLYKNAFLCLIPLRNTIQDTARFPNKIGEYCASRGVIITTAVGDIPELFQDGVNALVVSENTEDQITEKINWAISNQSDLLIIRKNSYEIGRKVFHVESHKTKFEDFIDKLYF